jgi:hypothetical protein
MQETAAPRHAAQPIQRTLFDFAAMLIVLATLVLISFLAAWQLWHANRIYTGVVIGGVPVGGMTRSEAHQLLSHTLNADPMPTVSLTYQDQQWLLQTADLHVTADVAAAVNEAYLVGRRGSPLADLGQQLQGM